MVAENLPMRVEETRRRGACKPPLERKITFMWRLKKQERKAAFFAWWSERYGLREGEAAGA